MATTSEDALGPSVVGPARDEDASGLADGQQPVGRETIIATTRAVPSGVVRSLVKGALALELMPGAIVVVPADGERIVIPFSGIARIRIGPGMPTLARVPRTGSGWVWTLRLWRTGMWRELRFFAGPGWDDVPGFHGFLHAVGAHVLAAHPSIRLTRGAAWLSLLPSLWLVLFGLMMTALGLSALVSADIPDGESVAALGGAFFLWFGIRAVRSALPRRIRTRAQLERALRA